MHQDLPLNITGDKNALRVSATDVASDYECGRFTAMKVRPFVKASGWRQSYARDKPFPLRDVLDLTLEAHRMDDISTYPEMQAWLSRRLDARGLHRLVRPFVEKAVENVLDAHEAIEADIGALSLLATNPAVGAPGRQLTVWGPLFATEDGTREIRRFRLGTAHNDPSDADARWVATAAQVAARFDEGDAPSRVRVVEIGVVDGTISVPFDGTPEEVTALFQEKARDRANHLVAQDHVAPCRACGDCKAAGVCGALLPTTGMLGQASAGVASRSVAPTALEKYATCPAQWLLEADLHLPKEGGDTEAIDRGNAVHRWLEAAHLRGVACSPDDLPTAGPEGLGLAEGLLTPGDYALARPFLAGHVDICPLALDGAFVVAVEEAVHAWDAAAQVVPVTKPDLVYLLGDRLVIRETKTMQFPPTSEQEAYSRHLQVPFMLVLLASGLTARHGAAAGAVELEVLGPHGPEIWAWNTDKAADLAVARADVRRAVEDWHVDQTWHTRTGPHCGWCPVRKWCPDRDTWHVAGLGPPPGGGQADPPDDELSF